MELSRVENARYHVLASANHVHECIQAMNQFATSDEKTA